MKPIFFGFFLLTGSLVYTQSYVDSGVRHFNVGEYDEAMTDFDNAKGIAQMLTETAKAKIYFYSGLIWIKRAEKGKNDQDAVKLAYENLSQVLSMDANLQTDIDIAYNDLSELLIEKADELLKQEKKAKVASEKVSLLDQRIEYLKIVKQIGINSLVDNYLGETYKQAGDVIYNDAGDISGMNQAKEYYEEAVKNLEIARYNDPFDKGIIRTILDLSRKLDDAERVKEYLELLEIAGG